MLAAHRISQRMKKHTYGNGVKIHKIQHPQPQQQQMIKRNLHIINQSFCHIFASINILPKLQLNSIIILLSLTTYYYYYHYYHYYYGITSIVILSKPT